MNETNIPETPAIKTLLKGLEVNVDLSCFDVGFHSEKAALLEVAKVLKIFCQEVTLNAMTYNKDDLPSGFTVKHLGMGIAETWRGAPDVRIRGTALEYDVPLLSGGDRQTDSESDGSNGTSTACEAKLKLTKKDFAQLVKTAVVASFIEANLHPNINTTVPTILIDTKRAVIAFYCSKVDILMISEPFKWRDAICFNKAGIAFLWVMINHRYKI